MQYVQKLSRSSLSEHGASSLIRPYRRAIRGGRELMHPAQARTEEEPENSRAYFRGSQSDQERAGEVLENV